MRERKLVGAEKKGEVTQVMSWGMTGATSTAPSPVTYTSQPPHSMSCLKGFPSPVKHGISRINVDPLPDAFSCCVAGQHDMGLVLCHLL